MTRTEEDAMARPPKEDWVPLMRRKAVERLSAGVDVKVMEIAEELGTSPALVHFYFGDRQHLVDEAWRDILWAFIEDDSEQIAAFAKDRDWDGVLGLVMRILSTDRDATHLAHLRAAVEAQRSEALASTLREVHETTIATWRDLLDEAVEQGKVETTLDHEALATLIVAVPIGLAAVDPAMSTERRESVARAYTAMLRSVLDEDFSPHAVAAAGAEAPAP
jgi:AcrR family transcriptional regulator